MESLYRTENIDISYDPEKGILHCKWKGKQSEEGIKKIGAVILKITRERKIVKILNDNTAVVGSWQDAADWASREWFPDMINAGLRYFAWILPTNIFAELSAKLAMSGAEDVVVTFQDYETAYRWLVSK